MDDCKFNNCCCKRRNTYCCSSYGKNRMANAHIPQPQTAIIPKEKCKNEMYMGIREMENTERLCLRISSPGAITITGPIERGEEYPLTVLNLDISGCGKRITELSFACNLSADEAALNVSIQIYKLWDCRQTWLPLIAPVRVSKNNAAGMWGSICFNTYDSDQIQSQCCSYLAMLRFLSPMTENANLTVRNSIMTAMIQTEDTTTADRKGII